MRQLALGACLWLIGASAHALPRTGVLLKNLDKTKGDDQIKIIRALGRAGKGKAVEPLLKIFDVKSNSPRHSQAVVEALGRLENQKAVQLLIAAWNYLDAVKEQVALNAPLQLLRAAIPEALSRIGGDEAETLLIAALGDKDDKVLEAAIRGVGRLRTKKAVDPLIELAQRGGDISQAVYESLGEIGDKKALAALRAGLKAEKAIDKIPAAYGLALINGEEGLDLLEGFMEPGPDGDKPPVLAAYYLVKLNKTAGLDHLTMLLGSDGQAAQPLAAEALGKAGNPKAVLPLTEALETDDPLLKLMAVRALGQLGGMRAVYALNQAKNDPNPAVRAAAKIALNDLGETD